MLKMRLGIVLIIYIYCKDFDGGRHQRLLCQAWLCHTCLWPLATAAHLPTATPLTMARTACFLGGEIASPTSAGMQGPRQVGFHEMPLSYHQGEGTSHYHGSVLCDTM